MQRRPASRFGLRNGVSGPRIFRRCAQLVLAALVLACTNFPICSLAAPLTWSGGGGSDLWSDGGNWSGGVPMDGDDLVFGASARTMPVDDLTALSLGTITFAAGAPDYQISLSSPAGQLDLNLNGAGIVNGGTFTVQGSSVPRPIEEGNRLQFFLGASAGTATIINTSTSVANGAGGAVIFHDTSSAASSTMTNNGGNFSGGAGRVSFQDFSSAGSSVITSNPALGAPVANGFTNFNDDSTAENATLIANGSSNPNFFAGTVSFNGRATAGAATLIANGGTNGGYAGRIAFQSFAEGGTARVILAGGLLDVTSIGPFYDKDFISIGSIEGAGTVALGAARLTVGTNNRSTEFSGTIQDEGPFYPPDRGLNGSLTKVGTGTLTLSGANTYTGGTTVNGGALGGTGSIAGAVTIANGGILAPGVNGPGTFTLGSLTLNNDAFLDFDLGTPGIVGGGTNDLLQVNGNLTLDGLLRIADAGGLDEGVYRLINYTGSLTDNELRIGQVPPAFVDYRFTIQTSVAGQINLVSENLAGPLLFWDGAQLVANGVVDGGSGTWDNARTNWTDSTGANQTTWIGSRAVFTAAAGTVTLGGDVTTRGMQFVTDGYVIEPAGHAITLAGTATIVRVDAGARATINAPLVGAGGLFKTADGTLVLNAANSYSSGTTVVGGTLLVNGSLGASSAVTVASGTTLGGTGTIGGAVTIGSSANLAPGVNGPGTLTLGALTLNAVSKLNCDLGPAGVVGGASNDLLQVSGNLTLDGIVNITDAGGFGLGTYRLINYVGALVNNGLDIGAAPAGFADNLAVDTSAAGQVNLVVSNGAALLFWDGAQLAANGAVDGGSGTWDNARTNWTNTAGSFQRAWTGTMALFAGSAGTVTLGENVSTTGMQFSTTGYIVNSPGVQTITLNGAVAVRLDSGVSATINAPLIGAGALTKTDSGMLTLTGNNTYTGGTTVADGVLIVQNASGAGLGTGPVNVLASPTSALRFVVNSSAGSIAITNAGSDANAARGAGGFTSFFDSATAGSSTITNNGNTAAEGFGGFLGFDGLGRAGSATINNLGAAFSSAALAGPTTSAGGQVFFSTTSNAESATIVNFAGLGNGLQGGKTNFLFGNPSAGTSSIANRGGTVAGAIGGLTSFAGNASASAATLTVEGGTNGGLGSRISFAATSSGGTARVIFNPGGSADGTLDLSALTSAGTSIGSIEGNGTVSLGSKRLTVGGNNVDTVFSGLIRDGGLSPGVGGSLTKTGTGRLTLAGDSSYTGGTTVANGRLQTTNTNGIGFGTGPVTVGGSSGTMLFFMEGAQAGSITITNQAKATVGFGGGGSTNFVNTSSAADATITNLAGTIADASGGRLNFRDTASAGRANIFNEAGSVGGTVQGASSGYIFFTDSATAGAATLTNEGGGFGSSASLAAVGFFRNSNAGSATLINEGGRVVNFSFGGFTAFGDDTSSSTATILNRGGVAVNANGGSTAFEGNASAASAVITNEAGAVSGAFGGVVQFRQTSTAGDATIRNQGATVSGAVPGRGRTQFIDSSSAGTSDVTNEGGQFAGQIGGATQFQGNATAGSSTILNARSTVANAGGGITTFFDAATAAGAAIENEGAQFSGQTFGITEFRGSASAGFGISTNRAGQGGFMLGGGTHFYDMARAGRRQIINEGGLVANGRAGGLLFFGSSDAEEASITNRGSTAGGAQEGGVTLFLATSSAGSALIINQGGQTAGALGGLTQFFNSATASRAIISSFGGAATGAVYGAVQFLNNSSARYATLTTAGASAGGGALGGELQFRDQSTADRATLITNGGTNGGAGGRTSFIHTASGGAARAITNAGGTFDISGLSSAGATIGAIQGAGSYVLGAKKLTIVGYTLPPAMAARAALAIDPAPSVFEVSGSISGDAGELEKSGPDTLVLSGINTYTGLTTVLEGLLRVEGSLAGPVSIEGGELGGDGMVNGGINIAGGGVIAPGGSIGSIETAGPLSLESDAAFELEIDSSSRTADRITANGVSLAEGARLTVLELAPAPLGIGFQFTVIENTAANPIAGMFAGFPQNAEFDLGANRFQISYTSGDGNDLVLTSVVPEPGAPLLLLIGAGALSLKRPLRRSGNNTARPNAPSA